MTAIWRALFAAFLLATLAAPVAAQPTDDDTVRILELRRATLEELVDVGRQLDAAQVRKVSEDWVIVQAEDGEYVQVSLERVDELVPWVQLALAEQDAAPALLRAIARHRPELTRAAEEATRGGWLGLAGAVLAGDVLEAYTKLKAGDVEGIDSDTIRSFLRSFFSEAAQQQRKADGYAALEAQLNEQREALEVLLAVFDAELEARGFGPSVDAGASQPSLSPDCAESDMWCDDSTDHGAIEYDALKGLTLCEDGDEACDEANPGTDPGDGPLPPDAATAPERHDLWDGCWSTDLGRVTIDQEGDRVNGLMEWRGPDGKPLRFSFDLVPLVDGYHDRLVGEFSGAPPGVEFACPGAGGPTGPQGSLRLDYTSDGGLQGSYLPCTDDDQFERVAFTGVRDSRGACTDPDGEAG